MAVKCKLCGSSSSQPIVNVEYNGLDYSMFLCTDCDLLQTVEHHHCLSPDYVGLESTNLDEERIWCQGQHKISAFRKWAKDLDGLVRERKRPLRLLDVGCGTGGFLKFAKELGCELYGFDASKAQADFARKEFPNVRHAASCSEYLAKCGEERSSFDVVTMWDVLEHLRNPMEQMRDIRQAIHPGGHIYVATPNASAKLWKQRLYELLSLNVDLRGEFMPWEHVFYYSGKSLWYLLSQVGFTGIMVGTVPCYRRPLSLFEIVRRALFFSLKAFPSKAFQIYASASFPG